MKRSIITLALSSIGLVAIGCGGVEGPGEIVGQTSSALIVSELPEAPEAYRDLDLPDCNLFDANVVAEATPMALDQVSAVRVLGGEALCAQHAAEGGTPESKVVVAPSKNDDPMPFDEGDAVVDPDDEGVAFKSAGAAYSAPAGDDPMPF